MNSLVVNENNEIKELRPKQFPDQPFAIRVAAKIISYIFHPVFIPLYVLAYMVYVHPYLFAGMQPWDKTRVLLMGAMMFSFFPLVTVFLLKGLKFISSIHLNNSKDRIIPLIACGVWYFWITYIWWNSYKMDQALFIPKEAVQLALATFIASWFALMANIRIKISLHSIATGVMLTLFMQMALTHGVSFGTWLCVAFVITGLVCTARFIVSDHTQQEVYLGLAAGIAAMLVAYWVV